MTKVPSLPYDHVVRALLRDEWAVVRQRGSHIRLEKQSSAGIRKITVPAHRPIKASTLSHILKQGGLETEHFLELL